MRKSFEPHIDPRCSKLEQYRAEITEMRAKNWPYSKIVAWLASEQNVTAGRETLRQFCCVRKIKKGGNQASKPPRAISPRQKQRPTTSSTGKKLFEYDDSKPIEIKR